MKNPQTVEKMRKSLQGRTFLSRGGNSKITVPQQALLDALGWPKQCLEFPIKTNLAKDHFKSLPNCYKVDIGHPKSKTAIEVDGNSHRSKKWKFLDKRKTEILNFLGWKVLRFKNEEVMKDPSAVAKEIMSTISK